MSQRKRLLDTSVLVGYWRLSVRSQQLTNYAEVDAIRWANQLVEIHETRAIVTPVFVEFVAGARSGHELRLARSFLSVFEVIDEARIPSQDWQRATRLAERVPRNGKRRQLGDCLIRAIADRLHYEVVTVDGSFPR